MPIENCPYLTEPQEGEHALANPSNTIGRAVECDVVIVTKRVSREHARIWREGRKTQKMVSI